MAEPVNQIAVQLAVIVAKAARFDVPRDWPQLMPALSDAVQVGRGIVGRQTLHFVILSPFV